jgi:hypothetical protein
MQPTTLLTFLGLGAFVLANSMASAGDLGLVD